MNIFGKRSNLPFSHEQSQEWERGFIYAWPEYYLQPNTVGQHCTWADHYFEAVICRSPPMKRKNNLHHMIINYLLQPNNLLPDGLNDYLVSLFLDAFIGIPTLILLDEKEEVISTNGRGCIANDPEGEVSQHNYIRYTICRGTSFLGSFGGKGVWKYSQTLLNRQMFTLAT